MISDDQGFVGGNGLNRPCDKINLKGNTDAEIGFPMELFRRHFASRRQIFLIKAEEFKDLHPLVKSFIEFQAGQCGYCLPGILMASKSLLDKKQNLSRLEIAQALDANLCRCGVHSRILDAIEKDYQLSNEKKGT